VASPRASEPAAPRIQADTRIAEVAAADPGFVDRLIALHPAFAVLGAAKARQPAARLVTLADAAAISGLPLECILSAAKPAAPAACAFAGEGEEVDWVRPVWLDRFDANAAAAIDVRPLIAAGGCPFSEVMAIAARVPAEGGLVIDAPFNPLPLRRVLGGKGFDTAAQQLGPEHWRVCCLRIRPREGEGTDTAPAAKIWRTDDGVHVDVRGLEAPAPLISILRIIDGGDHQGAVIVHLRRQPVYLFPELAERGWSWEQIPGEPGEVRLLLRQGD
jgi:hypothetical protein